MNISATTEPFEAQALTLPLAKDSGHFPQTADVTQKRSFSFWLALVTLGALLIAYSIAVTAPGFGICHDDSVYVVTAKALAEGKGYSIISLPNGAVQTKYPPLFPFLLAIVWRFNPNFPSNILFLRAVPFGSLIGWLWLTFVFAKKHLGETAALWVCVTIASSQWVVFTASTTMAEPLFGLLTLASIWFIEKCRTSPALKLAVAATVFSVLAYLTRTAGISGILVGCLMLSVSRRWRAAAVFAATCGLTLLMWSNWQHQAKKAETSIENYYTAQNYLDSEVLSPRYSPRDKLRIVADNVFYILTAPSRLMSVPIVTANALVIPMLFLLYWIDAIFWIAVIRGVRAVPLTGLLYTCCYLGMLLLWIWQPDRLMLPVLPLLLVAFCVGVKRMPGIRLPIGLVIPCMVLAALNCSGYALKHKIGGFGSVRGLLLGEDKPAVTDKSDPLDFPTLTAINTWIYNHTSSEDVVLAGLDPALYLYTGRHAIRPYIADGMPIYYWDDRPHKEHYREFNTLVTTYKPVYLVETGLDEFLDPSFFHLIRDFTREGRLQLAVEFGPHYRIFRFVNPAGTSERTPKTPFVSIASCR